MSDSLFEELGLENIYNSNVESQAYALMLYDLSGHFNQVKIFEYAFEKGELSEEYKIKNSKELPILAMRVMRKDSFDLHENEFWLSLKNASTETKIHLIESRIRGLLKAKKEITQRFSKYSKEYQQIVDYYISNCQQNLSIEKSITKGGSIMSRGSKANFGNLNISLTQNNAEEIYDLTKKFLTNDYDLKHYKELVIGEKQNQFFNVVKFSQTQNPIDISTPYKMQLYSVFCKYVDAEYFSSGTKEDLKNG